MTCEPTRPTAPAMSGQASSLRSTRTRARRRRCVHHGIATSEPPNISACGSGAVPGPVAVAALSHAPYLAYASQDGREWHGVLEETYTESALRPGLKLPEGPGSYPGPFSAIDAGSAVFHSKLRILGRVDPFQ